MKKIVALLILSFLPFSASFAAAADLFHYVIYIDAGSTGTRLHLYKYKTPAQLAPIVEEVLLDDADKNAGNTTVTMDSFKTNTDGVGPQLLKKLLDMAKEKLTKLNTDPKNPIKDVPVYLLGTAGMRSIPGETANLIYAKAKQYVADNYKDIFIILDDVPNTNNKNFHNLEGSKEALFGWLDINYLQGNLQTDPTTGLPKKTVGNIDFGGASVEIAFQTNSANRGNLGDAFKIGGQQYYVFILSFEDMGQTKLREAIINDEQGNGCFPVGSTLTKKGGNYNFDTCDSVFMRLMKNNQEWSQQLVNTLNAMLNSSSPQFFGHSGVNTTFKYFDKKLVGTGMDPTVNSASNKPGQVGTYEELANGIKSKCAVTSTDPKELSNLEKFCPNGAFLIYFLKDRLSIPDSQLTADNKISVNKNDKKIEWTLGAVINGLIQHNNS